MQLHNSEEVIIITAEGTSSWLREKLHPGSWVRMFGEGLVGDYGAKMQTLRRVDNRIAQWLQDLDLQVKQMEQALAAHRFTTLASLLAEINHKLKNAVSEGQELADVDREDLEHFDEGAGLAPEELEEKLAQAGWWGDKKREWVAKKFENREREKRQLALRKLVDLTRQVVVEVKEQMQVLGQARAAGNIGVYIDAVRKISAIQKRFHAMFSPIYVKYLAPIIKRLREREETQTLTQDTAAVPPSPIKEEVIAPEKQEVVPASLPAAQSVPVTQSMPSPILPEEDSGVRTMPNPQIEYNSITPSQLGVTPSELNGDRPTLPSMFPAEQLLSPVPIVKEDEMPETVADPEVTPAAAPTQPTKVKKPRKKPVPKPQAKVSEVERIWLKQANANFYQQLKQAAQQHNPYLLGWMMVKHAETIINVDQEWSLELLRMANQILES